MNEPRREPLVVRVYRFLCQCIYGPLAGLYNLVSLGVSFGQWHRWLKLSFEFIQGERILELGFGPGYLQVAMCQCGLRPFGLELSRDMHELTRSRLTRLHLTSRRVLGNGMRMPFAAQSFDTIVATFPEQYIAKQETLEECSRILKKGGRLVLIGRWIELRSSLLQSLVPVFYRRPSSHEKQVLEALMQAAGLRMSVQTKVMGWVVHHVIVAERN